ncbi:hypothetical protein [Nocardia carnea]|uniref:hypothetical protein n=1 Tax=Nocardia carnea TaxID=37328 RepID=UPI002456C1C6|nr:hypothetical protein [Nocardia carnea]
MRKRRTVLRLLRMSASHTRLRSGTTSGRGLLILHDPGTSAARSATVSGPDLLVSSSPSPETR